MATIEIRPDGPYAVTGLEELVGPTGAPIAHAGFGVMLCRCGGSRNKPFCDGMHKRNGFSGRRIADGSADKVDTYRAGGVEIRDNRSICAHAGACTDGLAAVFKYGSEPWIDPAGAAAQAIMQTVRACPSGALSCSVDGAPVEPETARPSISVTRDGPYAVRGITLQGVAFAQGADPQKFTLCRCGASKNKPFCDGSHWEAGFKDGM